MAKTFIETLNEKIKEGKLIYMDKYNNVHEINDLRFTIDEGVVLFYETKKGKTK